MFNIKHVFFILGVILIPISYFVEDKSINIMGMLCFSSYFILDKLDEIMEKLND